MDYSCVKTLNEIKEYLVRAAVVAFDFETSPAEKYRNEERAALAVARSMLRENVIDREDFLCHT